MMAHKCLLASVVAISACKSGQPAREVESSDFSGLSMIEAPDSLERVDSSQTSSSRPLHDLKHHDAPIRDSVPGGGIRVSYLSTRFVVGDCEMFPASRIILRRDGNAFSDLAARSTDDDDNFAIFWDLYDAGGRLLLTLPRPYYKSYIHLGNPHQWYHQKGRFTFDTAAVDISKITRVKWTGEC